MSSDSPRPASTYDIAILTLFDPKITAGGAQQCAYDLFLNFKKYTNLRICFISATSPITKLKPKANAFIRRSSNYDDEFYFFTLSLATFRKLAICHKAFSPNGLCRCTNSRVNVEPFQIGFELTPIF